MKLKLQAKDDALVAEAIDQHPSSEKTAIVTFNNGERAMASISKHFKGEEPLFLDDENRLLPGWHIWGNGKKRFIGNNENGGLELPS